MYVYYIKVFNFLRHTPKYYATYSMNLYMIFTQSQKKKGKKTKTKIVFPYII